MSDADVPPNTDDVAPQSVSEDAVMSEGVKEEGTPSPNFEIIREIIGEMTDEDQKREFEDAVFLLMDHPDVVTRIIDEVGKTKIDGSNKKEVQRYVESVRAAMAHHPAGHHRNLSPFDRKDAFWRQAMENNGDEVMPGKPRLAPVTGSLSGDAAIMRVRHAAGLGTVLSVPLWHTGIWLKIKAPSESTLLELERRIALDKVLLGRATDGVAFSNTAVYMIGYVLDMVLNHVYGGTIKDLGTQNLKSLIRITDIPQLIWGITCTIWPNGYKMSRPCVHDPVACRHVDEAHINLGKLSWVDNRALSQYQRNMMASREKAVTPEQLMHYRDEHTAPQTEKVSIGGGMSMRLRVPSIAEYEEAGYRWINDIISMTDEAFGQNLRGEERNDYLAQQAQVTRLRRYAHWIEAIEFDEGDSAIDNRDNINAALDDLSGNLELNEKIVSTIESFMQNAVISAIGIPRYACPSCSKEAPESDSVPHLPEIIQMEVTEVFFTLHYRKILAALEGR